MTASSLITVSVSLTMTRIATLRDEFSRATRMSCDFSLDLHQPEPGYPDRLLGICGVRHWYILDLVSYGDEAAMVLVPEASLFLKVGDELDGYEGR